MAKDLSQYLKPAADSTAKPDQARGPSPFTTTFDEAPFIGDGPKVVDQNLDELDFLDNIDFEAVATANEASTEAGEELVDDGDCDGCKI